jgi:hypothetical protein
MIAPRTRAAIIADAADALEEIRPDLVAELRALPKAGRKSQRDEFGFSPTDYHNADLWEEMTDRIEAGEDEGEVLANISERKGVPYDQLCNLLALEGCPYVRGVLKTRGRI